jgi:hypothetical protein
MLGLGSPIKLLWDSIPWTWLIDYFANIGDVIEAGTGLLSYDVTNMNVMCQTTVTDKLVGDIYNPGKLSWSGGTLESVSKLRHVDATPRPSLHYKPWLTNKQAGILGALATAKFLRNFK